LITPSRAAVILATHAGGALVRLAEDGGDAIVFVERVLHRLRIDRAAPRHVEADRLDAVCLAQVPPALAELAADDAQRLVAALHGVDHRRLHRGGPRARQHQHRLRGLEDPLQPVGGLAEDLAESGHAVVHDGARHGQQHAVGHRRRSGGEEILLQHGRPL
jgi:hypothetical protein